ncbi:tetratricopeptide repeat protein [Solidesulfovibrio sp. C21]|uniref:tetratricopeptide repeat protein n=1 Tax=Solidesulfovibrio sp. C21 TaxID=3398613 RepID=UPI0039FBFB55
MNLNNNIDWHNNGLELYHLNKFEEAIKSFDKAIVIDSNNAHAWNDKGNALANLCQNEYALEAYEEAIVIDNSYAYAWNGKGTVLEKLGRSEDALEAYEEAIAIDVNYAAPWNNKGICLFGLGRIDEAMAALEQAIAIDANYDSPWNGIGNIYLEQGRVEEALNAYERAISLNNNNAILRNNKGIALARLGKYKSALDAFDQAIALNNNYPSAWRHKGMSLDDLNMPEKARQAIVRFCTLASSKQLLQGSDYVLDILHQKQHSPFAILRLASEIPLLLAKANWYAAVRDIEQSYSSFIYCLAFLDMKGNILPLQSRLRAAGCLAFHMGDPVVAEHNFKTLHDSFPKDLLGQYYIISSRHNYCADISACLTDAVEAAKSYHGNDPEQHYYAARILAFAEMKSETSTALQNAGDYAPTLLLHFDMAREQGDTPAMIGLAKRFLKVERTTPPERRLLHPTPPSDFDFSSQDWLMAVLHYAKQQELMGEIQAFLENMDEPPFFEQRHTYANVLLVTHMGAWDLKTAWNLDTTSQAFIEGLMAERDEAGLTELRAELEEEDVNLDKIEATPNDKLEGRLAKRLEDDKASLHKERKLNTYLYKAQHIDFACSFTLMLFSLAKEGRKSPEDIKSALFDAYVAMASGGAVYFLTPVIPAALGTVLGAGAAGIASFIWHYRDSRKKAAHEAAVHDLDYRTFKLDLKTFLKEKQLDLPEAFWK